MTGLFPYHHGARNNGTFVLDKKNVTLAEMLKGAGYSTHAVISSYVLDSQFGLDQGFDVYDDDLSGGPQQKMFMFREIHANQTADKAIAWLKTGRPAKQPFFLWVHFFDPHADYEPPASFAERFPGERYEGEIAFADQQFGRVLAALDELKLTKDTLVVMTGDHGESLGDHGERTHGIFVYDSTTHVPMLFSGAGIPAHGRIDPLVRTIDIVPTILALLHIKPPAMDGRSLLPLINGDKDDPRIAYSESFSPRLNFGWSEVRAERSKETKFIDAPRPEVYDLRRDNEERTNLFTNPSQLPPAARPLIAQLRGIERGDPFSNVQRGQSQLDEESRRKLTALGYVFGNDTKQTGPHADPKDRIRYWELFEQAQGAIRNHQYPQALEMLRTVLSVDHDNVIAMASLANALIRMNHRADALQIFKRMIEIDPERDIAYLGASRVLRDMGQLDEAEKYARTVIRLQPNNPETYAALGDVLIDQNHLPEAEAQFRQAVHIDPHSSTSISGLGNCLNRAGRLREALAVLREGHQHDPSSQAITYNLAVVVEHLGDNEGAKKLYEDSLKIDSEHSMSWNNLGALYDRAGNRDEAIRCVTRARQADPSNLEAAYNLGVLLVGAKRYAEALQQLEDALRLNPRFVPAAVQRARLLTELDRKPEAVEAWKLLTSVSPGAWLQVARLQLAMGDSKQARRSLSEAIAKGGDRVRQAASKDEKLRPLLDRPQ